MNGYKLLSDQYRAFLAEHPAEPDEAREGIQRKIKALDILAGCTKAEKQELFNTGAFNDVIKDFLKMSMDNTGIKDADKRELMGELLNLLDTVTAEQAEQYYNER